MNRNLKSGIKALEKLFNSKEGGMVLICNNDTQKIFFRYANVCEHEAEEFLEYVISSIKENKEHEEIHSAEKLIN